MYKVSELLGKPLLSLSEAKIEGTVGNIYFDSKMQKGAFIMLFTCEDEVRFLPLNKLINISGDAAVILNSDSIIEQAEGAPCPINSYAFDQDGRSLGIIKDVVMDGAKVVSIEADTSLQPTSLLKAGSLLVFNTSGKAIKLKAAVKKETQKEDAPLKKEIELPVKTAFAPSYDFLIGKKLQRTISAMDGKIIAKEGESVTSDIIKDAKKEGKLVILALNAL